MVARDLEHAFERSSEELLVVNEQMSILDYELGIELFRRVEDSSKGGSTLRTPPSSGDEVYYKFDGEFWSDELHDYSVLAVNRCVD
jgi:hypothetical protein